jgi:hypothetical protein
MIKLATLVRRNNGALAILACLAFLTPAGAAQTAAGAHLTLILPLGGIGVFPQSGVISDRNGNLFGTTIVGGQYDKGTAFEAIRSGNSYSGIALHVFKGGRDGDKPSGGLIADKNGDFFGVTLFGGGS